MFSYASERSARFYDYGFCGNGTNIITYICEQDVIAQQISDFITYVLQFIVIYFYLSFLYIRNQFFR